MKAFVLRHGPGGGIHRGLARDVGEFDTVLEAEQFVESIDRNDDGNWAEIIECKTQRVLRLGDQGGTATSFWWTWEDAW